MSITAIESAMVERLRLLLKTPAIVREVYTQSEYTTVAEQSMVTPSVAVIYTGYTPAARQANNPQIQEISWGWMVVVNVRNARDTGTGAGVRNEASPIIDATIKAMLGFRPLQGFSPLSLEPAPGAALTDAGFGYYPFAFSTKATYRGTP